MCVGGMIIELTVDIIHTLVISPCKPSPLVLCVVYTGNLTDSLELHCCSLVPIDASRGSAVILDCLCLL